MARPKIYEEDRVATAIRLPVTVHAELRRLARARDVSVNYLVNRAVDELLTGSPGPDEETGLSSRPDTTGRSA